MNQNAEHSASAAQEAQGEISLKDLLQEISNQYGPETVYDMAGDQSACAVSDYRTEDGGYVIVFNQDHEGVYRDPIIVSPDPLREESGFGVDIHLSTDAQFIAVMSESCVGVHGKRIDYPVSVFRKNPAGYYSRMSIVYPKYNEPGSLYGDAMYLTGDGQTLFVSASNKINDGTTNVEGATGAVYSFSYDHNRRRYVQGQMIRPPFKDVRGFGYSIDMEQGDLLIESEDGRIYCYYYEDETWVFDFEIDD